MQLRTRLARLQAVALLNGQLLNASHEVLGRGNLPRRPRGWRHTQSRPQRFLQAAVADVQLHVVAIAERRTPAPIEFDLQEVVEAVTGVVLGFGAATIASKPMDKWLLPDFIEPHDAS